MLNDFNETTSNVMRSVCASLPAVLISGEGINRVVERVAHLPVSVLDNTIGFECRLADDRPTCDFFISANPVSSFAQYLIETGKQESASTLDQSLGWFMEEIGRRDSFLARWLRSIIVEYDVVEPTKSPPNSVGIFIESHSKSEDVHPQSRPNLSIERLGNPGVMTSALCAAVGREENPSVREGTEALFAALPANSGCSHVGAFPSRSATSTRIVFSMAIGQAIEFLQRAQWQGDVDGLRSMFSDLDGMVYRIGLACDVMPEGLSSRMGFELFLKRDWKTVPVTDWHPLLDYFHDLDLAISTKIKYLKTLPRRQYLYGDNEIFQFLSGINHLKLVVEDSNFEVKAYLGAMLRTRGEAKS